MSANDGNKNNTNFKKKILSKEQPSLLFDWHFNWSSVAFLVLYSVVFSTEISIFLFVILNGFLFDILYIHSVWQVIFLSHAVSVILYLFVYIYLQTGFSLEVPVGVIDCDWAASPSLFPHWDLQLWIWWGTNAVFFFSSDATLCLLTPVSSAQRMCVGVWQGFTIREENDCMWSVKWAVSRQ